MIEDKQEIVNCLKEMREACAACFRVISRRTETVDELETEFLNAGVKKGLGVRCDELIKTIVDDPPCGGGSAIIDSQDFEMQLEQWR